MTPDPSVSVAPRGLVRALLWGVPIVLCCAFAWRVSGSLDPADRFNDDFFYYVVPAEHWVDGQGSTFFPGEPTNGYHPLWFLWIAALYFVARSGALFFALVDLSLLALIVGFYLVFTRFLHRLTGDHLAALAGSAIATVSLAVIAKSAVEAALAAFCAALLLAYLGRKPLAEFSVRESGLAGLLAAVLVLARLDAALLIAVLAVVLFSPWRWRRVLAFAVGAAPLYLYLAINVVMFGHIATTSAAAKSLAIYLPPDLYFLGRPPVVEIPVIVVVVVLAVLVRRIVDVDVGRMALALGVAPVLQLIVQAFLSGWALFPWYFYLFVMAVGAAVALITAELRRRAVPKWVGAPLGALALLVSLALLVTGVLTADPWQIQIANIARRLQTFSKDHPGVYAMGDAAGTAAWLTRQPFVHLEGLMMSQDFLDRIRQRQHLEQVFRDFHVNYYVVVRDDGQDAGGCPRFAEPNPLQASPRAPAMTETICAAPVEVFSPGARYSDVRIFRINPVTGQAF